MRMRQGLMQAYEETTTSLISLRTDIMEQITARGAQILGTTEEALRARIANPGVNDEKSVTRK